MANGNASMAMLVTPFIRRSRCPGVDGYGVVAVSKPSVLGAVTGMVAGLGTITPPPAA